MYPTRLNNILDLILTNTSENIGSLSCVSAKSLNLSSDHRLMFFNFMLHLKMSEHDKRTVFNFKLADWDGLRNALVNHTTFPSNQSTDVNTDWERWKGLFLRVATEFIPLKSFKRSNSPPWIDGEV